METDVEAALALRQALEGHVAALEGCVARLVAHLAKPPPRIENGFAGPMNEIRQHIQRLQSEFHRIQHDLAVATRMASDQGERLPQAWYDLSTRVGLLRNALNQWPRYEALLRRQEAEPKEPLLPKPKAMQTARDQVADAALDRIHQVLNPLDQDASAAGIGAYADIAMPQARFTALIHAAYRIGLAQGWTDMSFLDVGCGLGLKLLTAAELFDGVAGIEFDPGYAARAQSFVAAAALPKSRIVEGDARAFEQYGAFQVIYMFRPMEDADAMAGLEAKIVSDAAKGTVLIAPYKGMSARHRAHGLWSLADGVYIVGATRKFSSWLRRRATFIGPAVRPKKEVVPSPWTPLLEASHANGFDLEREARLAHV